jgi:hypothetical protein
MSVQLILYPQNQATNNEFLVNGINFTGLGATSLYGTTAAVPSQDAITNSPPVGINTWYRYITTGAPWGVVSPPVVSSGSLQLFPNVVTGLSGIYQKLSGLTIAQSYTITINIITAAVGTLKFKTYTGSIVQSTTVVSSNTTQVTASFIATSTSDTILIEYQSVSSIINISDISVKEIEQAAEYEGQVIVDLYEDEDIPLTLSVDNFKNVAEKVQSYSKSFNLPATKRNNQIFTNLFEVIMVQDVFSFNPYIQTKCVLKQNGFILFEGYLRLIDIQDKESEISYNVNLYSEVVALKDMLENKTFEDLDFSELTHSFNKDNIIDSWDNSQGITLVNPLASTSSYAYSPTIGNLTNTNVLKYPFVDWTGQITLSDGSGSATIDMPELASLEQAFRPFIQLKYIINKIFADIPFTWSSAFFDGNFFEDLFMDFNWGADNAPFEIIGSGVGGRASNNNIFSSYQPIFLPQNNFSLGLGYSVGVFTASGDNQTYNFTYDIAFEGTSLGNNYINVEWVITDASGDITEQIDVVTFQLIPDFTVWNYTGSFSRTINIDETIYCRAADVGGNTEHQGQNPPTIFTTVTTSAIEFTSETLLDTLRGETNQWDFLKGLMTMFNIVSLPDKDNPTNIIFEPYNDIFITDPNIVTHDWTDKIDVSEMKLSPLIDLKSTTLFKYEEDDDDYVFNVYKKATGGYLYGSLEIDASTMFSGLQTILSGTEETVAAPFAATIPKPLFEAPFGNFIVPAIYSGNEDGATAEYENAPRVVQINTVKILDGGATYYIPAQNLIGDENKDRFLQCSHLSDIPIVLATEDINFGPCQLINPLGVAPVHNLYSTYWAPYYNELYNADTRMMTLKVALNPSDINVFKFNDKVFIKNRVFRVNKIDYKPNDLASVEFILIP